MKKLHAPRTQSLASTSRWSFHPTPAELRRQQDLPDTIPVPRRETARVDRGNVTFGEMARWMRNFLDEAVDYPKAAEIAALAKRFEQLQESLDALGDSRYADAEAALETYVAAFPDDKLAKLNYAQALLRAGKGAPALALIEEVSPVYGGTARHMVLRARALGQNGRRDEMVSILKEAHRAAPQNQAVVRELQVIGELIPVVFNAKEPSKTQMVTRSKYNELVRQRAQAFAKEGNQASLLQMAEYHLTDAKPDLAREIAEVVLAADPQSVPALLAAGVAECRLEKWDSAEAYFQRAIAIDAENVRVLSGLARPLFQTGRREEARALLERAFDKDNTYIEAAELLILSHDTELDRMNCALGLRTKYPSAWVPVKLVADLEFAQGHIEDALAKHRDVFARSDSDDALTMILHELDQLDRLEEGVELLEKLKNLAKRNAPARWNAANVMLKTGRVRPAVALLETLIHDPALPHETRYAALNLYTEVQSTIKG